MELLERPIYGGRRGGARSGYGGAVEAELIGLRGGGASATVDERCWNLSEIEGLENLFETSISLKLFIEK